MEDFDVPHSDLFNRNRRQTVWPVGVANRTGAGVSSALGRLRQQFESGRSVEVVFAIGTRAATNRIRAACRDLPASTVAESATCRLWSAADDAPGVRAADDAKCHTESARLNGGWPVFSLEVMLHH
jgi:hypothetical protein